MALKRTTWAGILAVLGAVNVGAVWFAARPAEPWHATIHAALAVALALWAERLRRPRATDTVPPGMQALAGDMDAMRRELDEAHERLDFAERVLSRQPDARRDGGA